MSDTRYSASDLLDMNDSASFQAGEQVGSFNTDSIYAGFGGRKFTNKEHVEAVNEAAAADPQWNGVKQEYTRDDFQNDLDTDETLDENMVSILMRKWDQKAKQEAPSVGEVKQAKLVGASKQKRVRLGEDDAELAVLNAGIDENWDGSIPENPVSGLLLDNEEADEYEEFESTPDLKARLKARRTAEQQAVIRSTTGGIAGNAQTNPLSAYANGYAAAVDSGVKMIADTAAIPSDIAAQHAADNAGLETKDLKNYDDLQKLKKDDYTPEQRKGVEDSVRGLKKDLINLQKLPEAAQDKDAIAQTKQLIKESEQALEYNNPYWEKVSKLEAALSERKTHSTEELENVATNHPRAQRGITDKKGDKPYRYEKQGMTKKEGAENFLKYRGVSRTIREAAKVTNQFVDRRGQDAIAEEINASVAKHDGDFDAAAKSLSEKKFFKATAEWLVGAGKVTADGIASFAKHPDAIPVLLGDSAPHIAAANKTLFGAAIVLAAGNRADNLKEYYEKNHTEALGEDLDRINQISAVSGSIGVFGDRILGKAFTGVKSAIGAGKSLKTKVLKGGLKVTLDAESEAGIEIAEDVANQYAVSGTLDNLDYGRIANAGISGKVASVTMSSGAPALSNAVLKATASKTWDYATMTSEQRERKADMQEYQDITREGIAIRDELTAATEAYNENPTEENQKTIDELNEETVQFKNRNESRFNELKAKLTELTPQEEDVAPSNAINTNELNKAFDTENNPVMQEVATAGELFKAAVVQVNEEDTGENKQFVAERAVAFLIQVQALQDKVDSGEIEQSEVESLYKEDGLLQEIAKTVKLSDKDVDEIGAKLDTAAKLASPTVVDADGKALADEDVSEYKPLLKRVLYSTLAGEDTDPELAKKALAADDKVKALSQAEREYLESYVQLKSMEEVQNDIIKGDDGKSDGLFVGAAEHVATINNPDATPEQKVKAQQRLAKLQDTQEKKLPKIQKAIAAAKARNAANNVAGAKKNMRPIITDIASLDAEGKVVTYPDTEHNRNIGVAGTQKTFRVFPSDAGIAGAEAVAGKVTEAISLLSNVNNIENVQNDFKAKTTAVIAEISPTTPASSSSTSSSSTSTTPTGDTTTTAITEPVAINNTPVTLLSTTALSDGKSQKTWDMGNDIVAKTTLDSDGNIEPDSTTYERSSKTNNAEYTITYDKDGNPSKVEYTYKGQNYATTFPAGVKGVNVLTDTSPKQLIVATDAAVTKVIAERMRKAEETRKRVHEAKDKRDRPKILTEMGKAKAAQKETEDKLNEAIKAKQDGLTADNLTPAQKGANTRRVTLATRNNEAAIKRVEAATSKWAAHTKKFGTKSTDFSDAVDNGVLPSDFGIKEDTSNKQGENQANTEHPTDLSEDNISEWSDNPQSTFKNSESTNPLLAAARDAVRQALLDMGFVFHETEGAPTVDDLARIASKHLLGTTNDDPEFVRQAAIALSYVLMEKVGLTEKSKGGRKWLEKALYYWLNTGKSPSMSMTLWMKITQAYKQLMAYFNGTEYESIQTNLESVIEEIRSGKDMSFTPKDGFAALNFQNEMTNNPGAVQVIKALKDYGLNFILTGSVAYADQTSIYRREGAPLHDIDLIMSKADLETTLADLKEGTIENLGNIGIMYNFSPFGTDRRVVGLGVVPTGYEIYDLHAGWNPIKKGAYRNYQVRNIETGEWAGSYEYVANESESFNGPVPGVIVDLLSDVGRTSITQEYVDSDGKTNTVEVAVATGGFMAKLDMLRYKDLRDLALASPSDATGETNSQVEVFSGPGLEHQETIARLQRKRNITKLERVQLLKAKLSLAYARRGAGKGTLNSGVPVDEMSMLAGLGVLTMVEGAIKFVDWLAAFKKDARDVGTSAELSVNDYRTIYRESLHVLNTDNYASEAMKKSGRKVNTAALLRTVPTGPAMAEFESLDEAVLPEMAGEINGTSDANIGFNTAYVTKLLKRQNPKADFAEITELVEEERAKYLEASNRGAGSLLRNVWQKVDNVITQDMTPSQIADKLFTTSNLLVKFFKPNWNAPMNQVESPLSVLLGTDMDAKAEILGKEFAEEIGEADMQLLDMTMNIAKDLAGFLSQNRSALAQKRVQGDYFNTRPLTYLLESPAGSAPTDNLADMRISRHAASSIAVGIMSVLSTAGVSNNMTPAQQRVSLGGAKNDTKMIPPGTFELLGNAGIRLDALAPTFGQAAFSALGLTAKSSDIPVSLRSSIEQALGMEMINYLMSKGLLEEHQVSNAELAPLKAEYAGEDVSPDALVGYTKFYRVPENVNKDGTRSEQLTPAQMMLDGIKENGKYSHGTISILATGEKATKFNHIGTAPKDKEHGKMKQLNTSQLVPAKPVEALNIAQKIAYRADTPMLSLITGFHPEFLYEMLGGSDPEVLQAGLRENQAGKNLSVDSAISAVMDTVEIYKNKGYDIHTIPMFFGYTISATGRFQEEGMISPQGVKLHRYIWGTAPSEISMDPNSVSSAWFHLSVAQALGLDVDKISNVSVLEQVRVLLADKAHPAHDVIEGLRAHIELEVPIDTNELMRLAESYAPNARMHLLKGLMSYAEYLIAQDAGETTLETTLTYELDGVTNGPFNATLMLGLTLNEYFSDEGNMTTNAAKLERGGFFYQDTTGDTYNQWKERTGKNDTYQNSASVAADNISNVIGDLNAKLAKNPGAETAEKIMSKLNAFPLISKLMPSFSVTYSKAGDVEFKFERVATKNPVTVTVYSGGRSGINRNYLDNFLNEGLLPAFYTEMDASIRSYREALERGDPDSAQYAIYEAKNNYFTLINASYSKQSKLNSFEQWVEVTHGHFRLKTEPDISANDEVWAKYLFEYTVGKDTHAGVMENFAGTLGMALNNAIESEFSDNIRNGALINQMAAGIFNIFNTEYTNYINELRTKLIADGKLSRFSSLTQAQYAAANKKFIEIKPIFQTFFSENTIEGFNASKSSMQGTNQRHADSTKEIEYERDADIAKVQKDNTLDAAAKKEKVKAIRADYRKQLDVVKAETVGMSEINTVTSTPTPDGNGGMRESTLKTVQKVPNPVEPGVRAVSILTLNIDAAMQTIKYLLDPKGKDGNVWDAVLARPGTLDVSSAAINTGAFTAVNNYNMMHTVASKFNEVLTAYPQYNSMMIEGKNDSVISAFNLLKESIGQANMLKHAKILMLKDGSFSQMAGLDTALTVANGEITSLEEPQFKTIKDTLKGITKAHPVGDLTPETLIDAARSDAYQNGIIYTAGTIFHDMMQENQSDTITGVKDIQRLIKRTSENSENTWLKKVLTKVFKSDIMKQGVPQDLVVQIVPRQGAGGPLQATQNGSYTPAHLGPDGQLVPPTILLVANPNEQAMLKAFAHEIFHATTEKQVYDYVYGANTTGPAATAVRNLMSLLSRQTKVAQREKRVFMSGVALVKEANSVFALEKSDNAAFTEAAIVWADANLNTVGYQMGTRSEKARLAEKGWRDAMNAQRAIGLAKQYEGLSEFVSYGMTEPEIGHTMHSQAISNNTTTQKLIAALKDVGKKVLSALGLNLDHSEFSVFTTAVMTLVDNNDPTAVSQSSQPLYSTTSYQPMTVSGIFESLNGLNPISPEHSGRLSHALDEVRNKLTTTLYAKYAQNTNAQKADHDVLLDQLDDEVKNSASTLVAQGFNMSPQENMVFQLYATAMNAALDKNYFKSAKSTKLYNEAKAKLTPADFMAVDIPVTDPTFATEFAAATSRYNAVFGDRTLFNMDNTTNKVADFVALARTNEMMINALSRINPRDTHPRGFMSLPFDTQVKQVINGIFNFLSDEVNHIHPSFSIKQRLNVLSKNMMAVESKKRGVVEGVGKTIKKGEGKLNNALKSAMGKAGKAIPSTVKGPKGTLLNVLSATLLATSKDEYAEVVKKTISEMSERSAGPFGFLNETTQELLGRAGASQDIDRIRRRRNVQIDAKVVDKKLALPKVLREMFHTEPSSSEATSITRGVIQTDLSYLRRLGMSLPDIAEIVSNRTKQQAQRVRLIAEIDALPVSKQVKNFYINQAIHLGKTMVDNKPYLGFQLMNAAAIARLAGTGRKIPTDANSHEHLIEQLATISALQSTADADLSVTARMLNNEPDAMEAVLLKAGGLRGTEGKMYSQEEAAYGAIKGYVHDQLDPHKAIVSGTIDDAASLRRRGFVQFDVLNTDIRDTDNKGTKLFYSDEGGTATYVQGAISTIETTLNGVNTQSGAHHGVALPKIAGYKKVNKMNVAKRGEVNAIFSNRGENTVSMDTLIPHIGSDGTVSSYQYPLSNQMKDVQLNRDTDFANILGAWESRQEAESLAHHFNDELAEVLHDVWKNASSHERRTQFVKVGPKVADAALRDMWHTLPAALRKQFGKDFDKSKFDPAHPEGKPFVMVRKKDLNDAMGFAAPTVMDVFTKSPEELSKFQELVRDTASSILGAKAARVLRKGERGLMEIVSEAKDWIVVKSIVVPMANIMSNIMQGFLRGISPQNQARSYATAYTAAKEYREASAAIMDLQLKSSMTADPVLRKEYAISIQELNDTIDRNPVIDLIRDGLLPSLVENLSSQDTAYTMKEKFLAKLPSFNAVPKSIRTIGSNLMLNQGSTTYQAMSEATALGDFVAKFAMYEELMRNGTDKQDALDKVALEFVDYGALSGKTLHYLNSIGVTSFFKYFLRSQSIIMGIVRENPVRVLQFLATGQAIDIPSVLSAFMLDADMGAKTGLVDLLSGVFSHPVAEAVL